MPSKLMFRSAALAGKYLSLPLPQDKAEKGDGRRGECLW